MKNKQTVVSRKIVCFGILIHVLKTIHQCLCFHYWDLLTNFWSNNWRSIFDFVERLCYYLTALESTMILLSTFAEYRFRVVEIVGQVGQLPLSPSPSGLPPNTPSLVPFGRNRSKTLLFRKALNYPQWWDMDNIVLLSMYRTCTIITRSWFETPLVYKLRILGSKIEEFPCLVHTYIAPQYKSQWKMGLKIYKPRLIMACVGYIHKWFIFKVFVTLLKHYASVI